MAIKKEAPAPTPGQKTNSKISTPIIWKNSQFVKEKIKIAGETALKVRALQACNLGPTQAGSPAVLYVKDIVKYGLSQENGIQDEYGDISFPFGANLPDGDKNAGEGGKGGTLLDTTEITSHTLKELYDKKEVNSVLTSLKKDEKNTINYKRNYITKELYLMRLNECGKKVRVLQCVDCGYEYIASMTCGMRTCPRCAKKRNKKFVNEVYNYVKLLNSSKKKEENGGYRLRFITLGYGIDKRGIRIGIKKALKAYELLRRNLLEVKKVKKIHKKTKKFTKGKKVKDMTKGSIYSLELGPKRLSIHIHILYWGPFIKREDIIKEWKRLVGRWYVDIRLAYSKKKKKKKKETLYDIIYESVKYITKIQGVTIDTLYEVERSIEGIRTFGTTGIFYGQIKPKKIVCPFCGSSAGFKFLRVEEKTFEHLELLLLQKQLYKFYDTS